MGKIFQSSTQNILLRETMFIQYWKFTRSEIYKLVDIFETPPSTYDWS